ncbi:MAG: enoyl-[acyl-carrier-protein] reductase FabV [Pseudonocardiales bacterium]|nr:enoyl-[acyl-carrier-protein] reductase FabV [Pseudonocardiales bacterium]MBV9032128.1 enoyl-[acyl-carrier-protein] reductase FabV [Pseudonocardiales bacterium]
MTARIIRPTGRGFLLLDAHPTGCAQVVADMWSQVRAADTQRRPVALIIGSSAGYGLAATIAGLARYRICGVGVCYEKSWSARRTATAGWYRTIETSRMAAQAGTRMEFVNADCFADATKVEVLDLVTQRFGPVDYLVYSVAAPRRTDPVSGITYRSVIKPIGQPYRTKTLVFDDDGTPLLREIEVPAAEGDDVEATVKVMGGQDWARWVAAMEERDLVGPGFQTVALSYIGSELTSAIYRRGTIGAAKTHLEQTATTLDARLADSCGGRALISVNGAAVTQSSTAIPGIALYVGLLRAVMGAAMYSPIGQFTDLWDQLAGTERMELDDHGHIRLDRRELASDVQADVTARWRAATPENIADIADIDWFRNEVRRLYGFAVPGVDYDQEVDPRPPWPSITPQFSR